MELILYLLLINFLSGFLMYWDKKASQTQKRRIPEKLLFQLALLGGGAGCWWGMKANRHKTKHKTFTIGIPSIIVLNLLCIYLLYILAK
ncbi:MAG: DUF1294 domain-containing protein [Paenibacillaceae bacterium]